MEHFPDLINKEETSGMFGIHYERMVAYLTKGIQEQQKMIEDLQLQVKELQQKA